MGSSLSEKYRFWLFNVMVGVALIVLFFYLLTKDFSLSCGLAIAMIIGGGLSNLIDRVLNNGAVFDFMNIGIGYFRTGIFNVADVAIAFGSGFLILYGLFKKNTSCISISH
jgi:signal peptidase II